MKKIKYLTLGVAFMLGLGSCSLDTEVYDNKDGGNAYTAGLDAFSDSIFSEDLNPSTNPQVAQLVNIIAAREADKDNPIYQKVVQAYQTHETATTLMKAYKGAYTPAWKGAEKYTY